MDGGWSPQRVSSPEIDRHLQRMQASNGLSTVGIKGMYLYGKLLLFVKLLDESSGTIVKVFDTSAGLWYEWTRGTSSTYFPVDACAWSSTSDDYYVIFGDTYMFSINDSMVQDDVSNASTQSYEFSIITDIDSGPEHSSHLLKNANVLYLDSAFNSNVDITVSYSDDDYANFTSLGTINLGDRTKQLNRLGKFQERVWKFSNTSAYAIELTGAWYTGETEELR
jgi:hypothetical protein